MKSDFIYQFLITTVTVSHVVALTSASVQVQAHETSVKTQQTTQESILYINPQVGTDTANAGKSASTPLRTITYALQQAHSGTVIQLAPGNYEAGETFPLTLKSGVILKGNESQQGEGVVLNGGGEYMSPTFARQNTTIVAAQNSQIAGITVTNPNRRGTGIWVESSNPVIRNSTFVHSKREGIFVAGSAAPIIEHNNFDHNDANGISVVGKATGEIRDNIFHQTGFGLAIGGNSAPLVADNHIRENRNGVVITEKARPILQGNLIENNTDYGLVIMSEAQPDVGNNNFQGNKRKDQLKTGEYQ